MLPDASSWQHCIHIVPFLWNVENDLESCFLVLQGVREIFLGKEIVMYYVPNSGHYGLKIPNVLYSYKIPSPKK